MNSSADIHAEIDEALERLNNRKRAALHLPHDFVSDPPKAAEIDEEQAAIFAGLDLNLEVAKNCAEKMARTFAEMMIGVIQDKEIEDEREMALLASHMGGGLWVDGLMTGLLLAQVRREKE